MQASEGENSGHQSPHPIHRKVIWGLFVVILMFGGLHIWTQWRIDQVPVEAVLRNDLPTYRANYRLLHLDREMTVPAWFSTLLIAFNAVLLGLLAWAHRVAGIAGAKRWALAAVICMGLSIDEAVALHENFEIRMRNMLGEWGTGLLFYAWIVPALGLVALVAGTYWPLMLRLPKRTRWCMVLAAGVYVMGAAGFEALTGSLVETFVDGDPPLQNPGILITLLLVAEETFEMLGMTIFAGSLLTLLAPSIHVSTAGLTAGQKALPKKPTPQTIDRPPAGFEAV